MKALLAVVWLCVAWLAGLIWLAPPAVHPVPVTDTRDQGLLPWPETVSGPVVAGVAAEPEPATHAGRAAAPESLRGPALRPPAQLASMPAPTMARAPALTASPASPAPTAPEPDRLAVAAQAKIDRLRARQSAADGSDPAIGVPASPMPLVMKAAANPGVAPSMAASADLQVVAGTCARLGLFPDAHWATRVVGLLLPGEPLPGMRWRIVPVAGKGYYLVVRGLTPEALSRRLDSRRPALGGLVSRWVRPESCA